MKPENNKQNRRKYRKKTNFTAQKSAVCRKSCLFSAKKPSELSAQCAEFLPEAVRQIAFPARARFNRAMTGKRLDRDYKNI